SVSTERPSEGQPPAAMPKTGTPVNSTIGSRRGLIRSTYARARPAPRGVSGTFFAMDEAACATPVGFLGSSGGNRRANLAPADAARSVVHAARAARPAGPRGATRA